MSLTPRSLPERSPTPLLRALTDGLLLVADEGQDSSRSSIRRQVHVLGKMARHGVEPDRLRCRPRRTPRGRRRQRRRDHHRRQYLETMRARPPQVKAVGHSARSKCHRRYLDGEKPPCVANLGGGTVTPVDLENRDLRPTDPRWVRSLTPSLSARTGIAALCRQISDRMK